MSNQHLKLQNKDVVIRGVQLCQIAVSYAVYIIVFPLGKYAERKNRYKHNKS